MPEISEAELKELREAAAKTNEQPKAEADTLRAEAHQKQLQDEVLAQLKNISQTAQLNPYEPVGWGKQIHSEFDITDLPSGQRCRAKKLGLEDAMALGLLESMDMFTPALMKPILDDGKPSEDESQNAMLKSLKDPEKRASFFGTVNRVVVHTVLAPKVVGVTNDDGSVNAGEVFINDIPFADKMHIFRCVFGTQGEVIAPFREGSPDGVAAVDEVPGV